jgi:uncharacterized membrane protein YagU involved in acid resistance
MRSLLGAGIVAGVLGGLVFGVAMQMMMAPTPDGGQVPMMAMVGQIPKSNDPTGAIADSNPIIVGWIYHIFNSAVIGGIFGLLAKAGFKSYGAGLLWGGLYGSAWWILGGLILMPILLGMPAGAPLMMAPMRPVAVGSLMGHLMFGLILGAAFVWISRGAISRPEPVASR